MKKIKTFASIGFVLALFAWGLMLIAVFVPKASAAYSYSGPALCKQNLVPQNGSTVSVCSNDVSFPIEGGSFQPNNCYAYGLTDTNQLKYTKTNCGVAPFIAEHECSDGSTQTVAFNIDSAAACTGNGGAANRAGSASGTGNRCGSGSNAVNTSINIGCKGEGNPIMDMLYAVIRFLSAGAGIVVIGSIIIAGLQYIASRGDPQATANAIKRITATAIAFAMYLLAFAILNFLVPGGLF